MGALMWAGTAVLAIVAAVSGDTAVRGIAAFLAVGLVVSQVLTKCLYRPPESCIGVIYRPADRQYRFVSRDEWTIVIPGVEQVLEPVSARMTAIKTHHTTVLTADRHPVEIAVDWAYRLDPREVRADFRKQFLEITAQGMWPAVISRRLNDMVGEVLMRRTYAELLSDGGRRDLKDALGEAAEARLRGFGLCLNPATGVILQFARPTARVLRAREERIAAQDDGPAARDRVADLVNYLVERGISAADLWNLTSTVHAARPPAPPATVIPLAGTGTDRANGAVPYPVPNPTGDDHPDAPRPAA